MTISEVCDHFIQCELTNDNPWRSYSTMRAYKAYLKRWIVPHWGCMRLSEVRTMEVESWLRRLPLAKSTCAKIRGLVSVLFNHACRHELFDRNPIRLVRQSAKRRKTPSGLTPSEIKALIDNLGLRERTLVLQRYLQKERDITLRNAINRLRPSLRSVVEVSQLGERSIRETSEIIGMSVGATLWQHHGSSDYSPLSRLFHRA